MVTASQCASEMAIKFEGQRYKVVAAEYHGGQGKMGGATHTRLQNLDTRTFWEHSFRSELKIEENRTGETGARVPVMPTAASAAS